MRTLAAAIILVILAGSAQAAFDLERPGARPAGMGGAFCAVADDADAMIYNAAGLGQVYTSVLALNYVSLLSGLDDGSLADHRIAYLQPLGELGTLGASWYQRNLSGIYQENIVALGYGLSLDEGSRYFVGGALKLFQQNYSETAVIENNPLFEEGASKLGFGVDIGGMLYLTDQLNIGLSAANLNQPDMALGESAAAVPITLRLGGTYQYESYLATLEYMLRDDHYRLSAGGEAWWADGLIGTRAGFGAGDQDLLEASMGLSLRFEQSAWVGQLDYAFVLPLGSLSAGGSHLVNVTVLFGTGFGDDTEKRAQELVAAGKKAQVQGENEKALRYWEQAAEIMPDNEALADDIEKLREEIKRNSEADYYIDLGLAFEADENYMNAAEAYRKAVDLNPKKMQASILLGKAEEKIRQMSTRQQKLQVQKEKQASDEAREIARQNAAQTLSRAVQDLAAAKKNDKVQLYFPKELERLTSQLDDAERRQKRKQYEKALVLAQTVSKECEGLAARAVRQERAKARKKKMIKKPVAVKPAESPAVPETRPDASAPASGTSSEPAGDEQLRKVKKRARGAYGRAVKLILDIDKLNGEKHYPSRLRKAKRELSAMKVMMNQEKYIAVIKAAEQIYPVLNALKKDCKTREDARKAMPTNW